MKISIHQPEHLVWMGFIDKVANVDKFVLLDSVQFRKNYYQNRNRIRSKNGWVWLTVPVEKHRLSTKINEIKIAKLNWQKSYLGILMENYRRAPFFDQYYGSIESIINEKQNYLYDLNFKLIMFLLDEFNIKTKIVKSSSLGLTNFEDGSSVVLRCCKKLKATVYLAGAHGKDYLDTDEFKRNDIKVEHQCYKYPVYRQMFEPFIPDLSSIDLLFNYGAHAKKFIQRNKR